MQYRAALLNSLIVTPPYDYIIDDQHRPNRYAPSMQTVAGFFDCGFEVLIHSSNLH
jgi:hypothetical protein